MFKSNIVSKVIVIISLCFLTSCASNEDAVIEEEITSNINYEEYYFNIVEVNETIIFDKDLNQIGNLSSGRIKLSKDEMFNEGYFNILNTEYYVKYDEVINTNQHMVYEEYIPYGVTITTNENYTLNNDELNVKLNEVASYDVYRRTDDGVYVYFNDQLVFINNTDINTSKEYDTSIDYANDLPVLMYHFYYDPNTSTALDSNWLNIDTFKKQLDYFVDNNYQVLTMKQVNEYMDGEIKILENSVALTIDDGDPSIEALAYNEMYNRGIPATIFLITSLYGDWLPQSMQDMRMWGKMDLQSHSHDMHRSGGCGRGRGGRILCESYDVILEDLKKSAEVIGDDIAFVYPFGDYDDQAMKVVEDAGYDLAFTTEYGNISPGMNKYRLPRIRVSNDASFESFVASVK